MFWRLDAPTMGSSGAAHTRSQVTAWSTRMVATPSRAPRTLTMSRSEINPIWAPSLATTPIIVLRHPRPWKANTGPQGSLFRQWHHPAQCRKIRRVGRSIECRDDVAGLQSGGGVAAARGDVAEGAAGQRAALLGRGVGDGRPRTA